MGSATHATLLGRSRELETLRELARAASNGRGGTLVVHGEPGIGKTTLLSSVEGFHATGYGAESAVAFATLQALIWPLRDRLGQLEPAQRALVRSVLELEPQRRASTFTIAASVLALLSAVSREEAVVAVVDDAHWADSASQEVLCFVGRRLEHEHVAIVAAVRTDEPSLFSTEPSFEHLQLGGLEDDAAATLLAESSPSVLAAPVSDRLIELCAGNPLGLIELPLALSDEQRHGSAPLPARLEAGPLVQRAFAARAAALGEAARSALLLLAASGDADAALAAMSGDERRALPEAAALIALRGTPGFRHPLMQAAVYGAAVPAARRAAHRRLAVVTSGARRAWHLADAAEGADAAAASALEQAAEQARLVGGVAAQAEALERAAALSDDGEVRAQRLLAAARASRLAGRPDHAQDLLTQALEHAAQRTTRGEIQLERGSNLIRETRYREAYELLLAEATAVEREHPDLAARLYAAIALAANLYPDAASPLDAAERAVALAGGRGGEVELEALFAFVTARMHRPLPPDADDDVAVARAAELLERPELRTGEEPHWVAYALVELERDDDARRLSDVALGEARDIGNVSMQCYGMFARAVIELVAGRPDAARTWAAEAVPLAEQIGERWRIEQADAVRVEVEAARGNVQECEDAGGDATDPDWGLHLGRALLAHGRFGDAVAYLDEAARRFATGHPRSWYRQVPTDLAEAYAGAGDRKRAERILQGSAPAIEGCRLVRPRARLARVRALLAHNAKVDGAFAGALEVLGRAPHQLEHARVELCWGERLRRAGRAHDAAPHLEDALTRFDALGVAGWSDRARRELEAATGSPLPRQPRRTDVLTAQELRVSRHASTGMRDREIAALLYLSPRTVESYLQSAYRKLDVANRTQLAGILAAEGVAAVPKDS